MRRAAWLFIPTLSFAQKNWTANASAGNADHLVKEVVRELIIRFGDRNSGFARSTKHIIGVSVAAKPARRA